MSNMPVQRLKVAILPLDLPCSGPLTHSGEILTTGKSHGKKPETRDYAKLIFRKPGVAFVTVPEMQQTNLYCWLEF